MAAFPLQPERPARIRDVLKPWLNGMDITRRPPIDGSSISAEMTSKTEAALYRSALRLCPDRMSSRYASRTGRIEKRRLQWWQLRSNRARHPCRALKALDRFIVTPARGQAPCCSSGLDQSVIARSIYLIAIARDDDTSFGILHSQFHEAVGTSSGHLAWRRQRPAIHPLDDLRDLPLPRRADAEPAGGRICRRPARCQRSPRRRGG